jgi:dihydrofolate reductase
MRTLFSFNMMTLDGYFEGPDQDISWHNTDEEFNDFAVEQTSTLDLIIFGRVTFEGMASYWPTPEAIKSDPVVAGIMNATPKIVISRTLQQADWNNSRLISDNIAEEINALKQQPGRDMAVFGSANLLASLMALDLIDEHRVMVNPVVIGAGTPLFQNVKSKANLKLVKNRIFKSGNVLLTYAPVRGRSGSSV